MNRTTVTLILPNYNHARYLRTSLAAICAQTRPADEIIVVDDGSTDDSLAVIEDFAARHANLRVLRNERNCGADFSARRALAAAKGECVAFLAADDRVLPEFVELSLGRLEKYPQAGLCFSAYAVMDAETERIHDYSADLGHGGAFDVHRYPEYMPPLEFRKQLRGGIVWISGNSVILRRDAMRGPGRLYPELRWHEDWFMQTVIALRRGVCVVPKVLSAIRATPGSMSSARKRDVAAQRRVIQAAARKLWLPARLDLALSFLRYPVLLTPLEEEVLPALVRSPFGWPFALSYAKYCLKAGIPMNVADAPGRAVARWARSRFASPEPVFASPVLARRKPTVSVLLANYNHAHFLRESLPAFCMQTRPPDELILVDDGSTDDSVALVEGFARRYPFVKLLRNERNRGQLHSIRRALEAATGDYVNWAAADDRVAPQFLERSLAVLERHPEAGLCQTEYALFSEDGGPTRAMREVSGNYNFSRMGEHLSPWRYREWLKDELVWLSTNGALVRRDALLEMGGYHAELEWHADWFASQALALRYGICLVPEPLAALRERAGSYSHAGMNDRRRHARVLDAIFKLLRAPECADIRPAFDRFPVILTALGAFGYEHMQRRPWLWHYVLRRLAWRFLTAVSTRPPPDLPFLLVRSALLSIRSLIRFVLTPVSVMLQSTRPWYQATLNSIERLLPRWLVGPFRWLRRQLSSVLGGANR